MNRDGHGTALTFVCTAFARLGSVSKHQVLCRECVRTFCRFAGRGQFIKHTLSLRGMYVKPCQPCGVKVKVVSMQTDTHSKDALQKPDALGELGWFKHPTCNREFVGSNPTPSLLLRPTGAVQAFVGFELDRGSVSEANRFSGVVQIPPQIKSYPKLNLTFQLPPLNQTQPLRSTVASNQRVSLATVTKPLRDRRPEQR